LPPTYRLFSGNCQWPGYHSTNAAPWSRRCKEIAAAVHKAGATLAVFQELGQSEAHDMGNALGQNWEYQRSGLNCVFWDHTWKFDEEREWNLPTGPQWPTRTIIVCRLIHATSKQYLWVASTHFISQAPPDVTQAGADKLRAQQAATVIATFDGFHQLIIGADVNSKASEVGGVHRKLAEHFTIQPDGIDVIACKDRVIVSKVATVDLKDASDHDAHYADFTIINPP